MSRQKFTSFVFRRAGGFTLIELIVTVTVIMVLAGVGAASLNGFRGIKELESIREEVSNHIKLARNLAITKQLPNGLVNLEYVRVIFSGNEISVEGVDAAGAIFTTPPYSEMRVDTSGGISVTSSANFGFSKSTGRLTNSSGVGTSVAVVVTISRGTDSRIININDLGVISNGN